MPWIAPAIMAVGSVASAAINANKKGGAVGGAGEMMPSGNGFTDSSMNNSGFVVTTNGSTAKVTANTDRTQSPQMAATTPLMMGGTGGGLGIDTTTLLILAGMLLIVKRKK